MAGMSVQEYVSKILHDKAYLQEVVNNCWDVEFDGDGVLGVTFGIAAERMGLELSRAEIDAETRNQLQGLGALETMKFLRAIVKAQKRAKKAYLKAQS